MAKTNAETMTVRLPTEVAQQLIKLRDDKNLPTIGSALQVYVQKMKDDQLSRKFRKVEMRISKLEKTVWPVLSTTAKISCKLAAETWGPDSALACEMRDLLECPLQDRAVKKQWKARQQELEKMGLTYPEFKKLTLEQWRKNGAKDKASSSKGKPETEEHVK